MLAMRGIILDSCCPLCNNFLETISHLLRDCMVAKDFWYNLKVPPEMVSSFVDMDLFYWLRVNYQSKVSHSSLVPWSYVFTFAIWNLWKHRNGMVFNNTVLNVNLHIVSKYQALEFYYCVGKLKSQRSKVVCNVSWKKPPSDQIGVQNLKIELDAKVVVELVQSKTPSNAFYSSLLVDCKSLMGKFRIAKCNTHSVK
ncbi:hypothetical protein RGQ29_009991 [Quercus rubra]|uniref:Reverse transcriptase zinc-binding domain-containing protein n=1 Tax=Quercus rubra TaxID=3512 RepID=A0AAN7G1X4_QUERU|nr:hypothetical protein RGQ29_009991 [Quercus rubra]